MEQKLSLAVITKNEESNIKRCIQSVPFADEVIVVDSGSTDRTVQIAESLGAKVIEQPWLGFQGQKQLALEACRNDWVLSLDADEEVSPELASEIQQVLKSVHLNEFDAYKIPRLSFHFQRWIRHGGWYPDFQIRLINQKRARWAGGKLHEFVEASSIGTMKTNMHHYVFRDLSHQVQTNDYYSTLGARELIEKNHKFSILKLI